jgi:hypothetical protein
VTQALIRQALEAPLNTYATANSIVVAWQNVELAQQPTGLYLRSFVLPLPTISEDIGRQHRRYEGVYQVSIVAPFGGGWTVAEAALAALIALYPPDTDLLVSALRVHVLQPLSPAPALQERDRFVIPCSLQYRADTYP